MSRRLVLASASAPLRSSILSNALNVREFCSASSESESVKFDIPVPFETHLCDPPEQSAVATKQEMLEYHRVMYGMRRMEISCDQEYKAKHIRGFCHLYDGQEAVAVGTQAALTNDDDWITTYRCHGAALVRGSTYQEIFEEQFGYKGGVVGGKGGSMHMYNKKTNFYGGAAIVGAQVPVGTGLAFFHKYKRQGEEKTPVSLAFYGDGSANQGQCWEAANMAALWKIPIIFVCENNMYGMGTSVDRSSANTEYYKQGNFIPGIKVDGMDVLAVREGVRFAKEYASAGNGPMYMEMKTYRYHGHSMSDPGITYRTRDEVSEVRQSRDPIESIKKKILDAGFATEDELKATEKEIRTEVQQALAAAKASSPPPMEELFTDIYSTEDATQEGKRLVSEFPEEIRMPDRANTRINN
mmetsp:Transcript_8932/g.10197  ORF Transcript_8932/g.10197 Transcript_8932/m.10197 type:complete len:412 (+) Transcript_8932:3-1238(+)